MDDATIEKNVAGIKGILAGLLQERNAPVEGMILNNLDWFGKPLPPTAPPSRGL